MCDTIDVVTHYCLPVADATSVTAKIAGVVQQKIFLHFSNAGK